MRLLVTFTFMLAVASAGAGEDAFRDRFDAAFMATCEKTVLERAARDFAGLAGMPVEKLASGVREKIHTIAKPLLATCSCARDKTRTSIDRQSQTEAEVTIEGLSRSPECMPGAETASSVTSQFHRLLLATPALAESLRQHRSAFSIDAAATGHPSLFASEHPPPRGLPRLVFLAPGTGSACPPRNICVDKLPLEVSTASELLTKNPKTLGKEGVASLKGLIERFGEEAKIITSGHNFTNFLPDKPSGRYSCPVAQIDNQPIDQSRIKRLWLIVFSSPTPADPRALEFLPALTTVVEVEFSSAKQN